MVALALYRADRHDCGHALSETTKPDAEGQYVADIPSRCHACHAIAAKQVEYKDAAHPSALVWSARRR
jgi:hypothetical protein